MLFTGEQLKSAFESIVASAASAPVLIMVAADADSISAARILIKLLGSSNALYRIIPVGGYSDVRNEAEKAGAKARSIVMINCGGVPKLADLFWPGATEDEPEPWTLPPEARVYIIDSHRPFYHTNVRDDKRIVIFDYREDAEAVEGLPIDGDSTISSDDEDEEEGSEEGSRRDGSGSDSEDEEEGEGEDPGALSEGDGEAGGGRKRRRRRGGGGSDDDEVGGGSGRKRKRLRRAGGGGGDGSSGSESDGSGSDEDEGGRQQSLEEVERKDRKRRRRRFRDYYVGHYFGYPAAFIMFELSLQLHKSRNDLLWLAIVGVTEHFLMGRIDRAFYDELVAELQRHVTSWNGSVRPTNKDNSLESAGREGWIAPSREPLFVAYRHWNLRDAMCHSDYIATRLRDMDPDTTWESVSENLDRLLALTGVPTRQCKQAFMHMGEEEKTKFFSKLRDIATGAMPSEFGGLQEESMYYDSFIRVRDREPEICAADAVYAVHGLLSAGTAAPALLEVVKASLLEGAAGHASGAAAGGAAAGGSSGAEASGLSPLLVEWADRKWTDCFNEALDCLAPGGKQSELFWRGLSCYMAMRAALLRIAAPFSSSRNARIINGSSVKVATLTDELTDVDRRVFTQPLALVELGGYIIKLHRDALGRWRNKDGGVVRKPLLLVVRHPAGVDGVAYVTVMGLPIVEDDTEKPVHSFYSAFNEAATTAEVGHLIDAFDSTTMLLPADGLQRFLAVLDPKAAELMA